MDSQQLYLAAALLAALSALVSLGFLLRARRRVRLWEEVVEAALAGDRGQVLSLLAGTLGVEALYLFHPPHLVGCWDPRKDTRSEEAHSAPKHPLAGGLEAVWFGTPRSRDLAAFEHQILPVLPFLQAAAPQEGEDGRRGYVALGKLAAGVAHELNTPLAAILTSASRLAREPGSERRAQTIIRAVERCKTVVDKLMLFARRPYDMVDQDVTFSQLVRLPVDLDALAAEVARRLEEQGHTVELAAGGAGSFTGDAARFTELLTGLAGPNPGGVKLSTGREDERLRLTLEGPFQNVEPLRQAARDHEGELEVAGERVVLWLPSQKK